MKHFKLMKGILTCLLSLALVVTCFTVGAKADEATKVTGTPKVTFTLTVGEGSFTYTVNKVTSEAKEFKVTLAELTEKAETAQKNTIDSEYPDGIFIGTIKKGGADLGNDDAAISYDSTKKEFTVKLQEAADATALAAKLTDVEISIPVYLNKVNVCFTGSFDNKTYTAYIPVDNKKNTNDASDVAYKISAADIIAKLQTGTGDDAEALDKEVVITKFGDDGVDDYAASYEGKIKTTVNSNVAATVTITLASAYSVDYIPSMDSVKITAPVKNLPISYAQLKAASGKISKFATVKTNDQKIAYISLSDKSKGVKVAENKATYLYLAAGNVTADKKATYAANYQVDATSVKKVTVALNYALADPNADKDTIAISSIVIKPTSGSDETYAPSATDQEKNAAFAEMVEKLQYSLDGTEWFYAQGAGKNTPVLAGYTASELTGVTVVITDYKKLIDGAFAYDNDAKDWVRSVTSKSYECTNKDLTVTGTPKASANVVYTYVVTEAQGTEGEEGYVAGSAVWKDSINSAAVNDFTETTGLTVTGTPKNGDKITVTVKTTTYKLSDGATVTTAEDATVAGTTITLTKVMDDLSITGARLYSWTQGKGTKVQFRISGSNQTGSGDDYKNGYRNSKVTKGSVKGAAKAPKAKVNGIDGTIAVKNGMDFAVLTAKGTPEPSDWNTILPQNKNGKAASELLATTNFVPAKKCTDATAAMFTTEKIKTLSIAKLFTLVPADTEKIYVYVRTSAKDGKPASAYTEIEIAKATVAPTITALKSGNLAEAVINEKGTDLAVPTITNNKADKNTTYYEYLILDKDTAIGGTDGVDLSAKTTKWTKFKDKLTVGKSSSKYAVGTGKAEAHTLAEGSIVLVRRAGTKAGILPSEYVTTTITKGQITVEKEQKDAYIWTVVTP